MIPMLKLLLAIPLFFPVVVFAQYTPSFASLLDRFSFFLSTRILPILIGLALVAFFYGIARYIFAAREGAQLDKAKGILIWSVVALFVMFSIGGIILLLQNTLGIRPDSGLPRYNESDFRINTSN